MPNQPSDLKSFMEMLKSSNWIVLDTETTGLHDTAEIVQLAIVGMSSEIILNTFVKPTTPISADAMAITGITNDKVADAPTWFELLPELEHLLSGTNIITYGATFDRRLFHQSDRAARVPEIQWDGIAKWHCVMTAFAERFGTYNAYRGSYQWKKLVEAVAFYGLKIENAHDALGDAFMTWQVIDAMQNDPKCVVSSMPDLDKTTLR